MKKSIILSIAISALLSNNLRAQTPWIVGGNYAEQGQFPWVGDTRASVDNQTLHLCGSSLIYPGWVLTAAHCSSDIDLPSQHINAIDSRIRFNSVNTKDGLNPNGGVERGIKKIFVHPQFNLANIFNGYDIALLQLKEPVPDFITPISLPSLADTIEYATGNKVNIAGWGRKDTFSNTQDSATPNTMKWCETRVYDFDQANAMTGGQLSNRIFAAGYRANESQSGAAQGDSGGPVWKQTGNTKKIIGLVSFGMGETTLQDKPGFFTKVALYRKWIDSVVDANEDPTSVQSVAWNDNEIKIGTSSAGIHLYFDNLHSDKVYIQIYSFEGRVIYKMEVSDPSFKTYTIDTQGMAKGMYVLRIYDNTNHRFYTRKLVNNN